MRIGAHSARTIVLVVLVGIVPQLGAEEFSAPTVLSDPGRAWSFGWSVAVSGRTLAVGDNDSESGSVWLFERRARNPRKWRLVRRLTSPLPQDAAYFGRDLELDGDLLVVAVGFSDGILIFARDAGGRANWGLVRKLRGVGEIALDGDLLAVSSSHSVKVYQRDLGGPDAWGLLSRVRAEDIRRNWAFDLDLSGRTLVVGSARAACGGFADICSDGYRIFERDPSGAGWAQIRHVPQGPGAAIGLQVLIDGPTLVSEDGIRDRGDGAWDLVPLPASASERALRGHTIAVRGETIEVLERKARERPRWWAVASLPSRCEGELRLGPRELVEACPHGELGTVAVYPRAPLFADGFERPVLSRWARREGEVRLRSPGLGGSGQALAVDLDGTDSRSFVRSRRTEAQPSVSLDFTLLAGGARLDGGTVEIARLSGAGQPQARVLLTEEAGRYLAELWASQDDGPEVFVGAAGIPSDTAARLTVEWRRAAGPLAGDGAARLLRAGQVVAERRDLSNDESTVRLVTLGLPAGSAGTSGGTLVFDRVVLHR